MRRLLSGLLVLSLLGLAHLHLVVLQVVAWGGMLARYSQDRALAEAVEMTFDGDHPCPLCCAIEKARTQPDHALTAQPAPDAPQLFLEQLDAAWAAEDAVAWIPLPVSFSGRALASPPVPPPRCGQA